VPTVRFIRNYTLSGIFSIHLAIDYTFPLAFCLIFIFVVGIRQWVCTLLYCTAGASFYTYFTNIFYSIDTRVVWTRNVPGICAY
jgi:hypothetical protein